MKEHSQNRKAAAQVTTRTFSKQTVKINQWLEPWLFKVRLWWPPRHFEIQWFIRA